MNRIFRKLVAAVAAIATGLSTVAASAQTITYFHNDVAGSPVAATNSAGDLVWKEGYTPYGMKTVQSAAAESNRIGYTGKPYDADLDVSYMGARYYSPTYGRFLGMDPVEFDPNNIHSFNRYAYANNNPYRYVDADGRMATWALAGLVLGTVAVTAAANYNASPEARRSADQAARAVSAAVQKLGNWLRADAVEEQGNGGTGSPVSLPDVLVGDQSDPRAGPNKGGNKHTSGPLRPEHGGTGDFQADLEKLTGGVRPWQPGDKAPPGSVVGDNGVFGRPGNRSGGKSIDIPAKGNRPHETLHYP